MRENEQHRKTIAQVSQEAGYTAEVGKRQYFVTRLSMNSSVASTLVSREYTLLCRDRNSQLVCALNDNLRFGPVVEARTTYLFGRTTFHRSLDTIETESPKLYVGAHQWKFQSIRLSNTRFGTICR